MFYNRPKPAVTQQWIEDAAFFDGTGYAKIIPNPKCSKARFELDIKLVSRNGILLLLRNEVKHFACNVSTDNQIMNPTIQYCDPP